MSSIHNWTKYIYKSVLGITAFIMLAAPLGSLAAAPQNRLEQLFQSAAAEFGVPPEILKAISYSQSRFENHEGKPSTSGGYGLMHLTSEPEIKDGRGDPARPMKPRKNAQKEHMLDQAAQLLGVQTEILKKNDAHNIRGAAALLAKYAQEDNEGELPKDKIDKWYTAVARFSDMNSTESAEEFADVVYQTIEGGVTHTTMEGDTLGIAPRYVKPDRSKLHRLKLPKRPAAHHDEGVECPRTITCKWVPARFAQNNPDDPFDYGNYDLANREEDFDIKYIIIHTTEGSYQSAIDWYQDPRSYVSAQYTIRSSDGEVTQSVKNHDIAWQAGNWYMNTHSIGIEHEGFAAEGASWYTEAMYRSSAELVKYLAKKHNIPLDREHIVGHDQYHGVRPANVPTMHWDPGPYWDWEYYMKLLQRPAVPTAGPGSSAVIIAPKFKTNKPLVTQCSEGVCTPLPEQSANFTYVRTEPSHDAPLINDAGLHPDGSPSTTRVEDWGAKATHGQRFAVAGRQGDWTAIWFNGQKGWIHNPGFGSWGHNTLPAKAKLVTPKDGLESVPIYGRPLPEPEAYPADVPVVPLAPLQYTIPAGQSYVAYEKEAINDYYHQWTFDGSSPGDGTIVVGNEKYIPIVYNHRQAFVKASDVAFVN